MKPMRIVVQRVSKAEVRVENEIVGRISRGLLVLQGIQREDSWSDAQWLAERLVKLRIFDDEEGRMNHSLREVDGAVLLVSQFTLYGTIKKGNRPSYNRSAGATEAVPLYEAFAEILRDQGIRRVETGSFGAQMEVNLTNDGPVTLILDSRNRDF